MTEVYQVPEPNGINRFIDSVIDNETLPPVKWAAVGALVMFAVAGAAIEAGRSIRESIEARE